MKLCLFLFWKGFRHGQGRTISKFFWGQLVCGVFVFNDHDAKHSKKKRDNKSRVCVLLKKFSAWAGRCSSKGVFWSNCFVVVLKIPMSRNAQKRDKTSRGILKILFNCFHLKKGFWHGQGCAVSRYFCFVFLLMIFWFPMWRNAPKNDNNSRGNGVCF